MKKVLVPAAIVALMGVGGYFAKSATTQNEGLSDLELANAEALADPEWEITIPFHVGCIEGIKGCNLSNGRYYAWWTGVYADGTTD